ncbi:MAG: amidinotransferase [Chloroflexi bacterium]|nr:amidinotransferase [Chloroflexota bacterium]
MTTLLMCPPDYYSIEYEINPWMSRRRKVDTVGAQRQWQELYTVLTQEMGARVELLTPVKGLPDLVFTANAGLVWGKIFVSSNFRYQERVGESSIYRSWFEEHGYEVRGLPERQHFEGEGDAFLVGENLFCGYRFRSDIRSHLLLGEIAGKRALSLELADPRFYHLDTCFCPLNRDVVLFYPGAFDDYGRRVIREYIPHPIEVSEEEALRFGCNSVVIGNEVVISTGCPVLKARLMDEGYTVYELNMSEFIKSGGGAKCLVLFIEKDGDANVGWGGEPP